MRFLYLTFKIISLCIVLVLISSCANFLFVPYKQHFYTPDDVSINYDDIYLEFDSGLTLHGWHLKTSRQKKGSILFLHCNRENTSAHFACM